MYIYITGETTAVYAHILQYKHTCILCCGVSIASKYNNRCSCGRGVQAPTGRRSWNIRLKTSWLTLKAATTAVSSGPSDGSRYHLIVQYRFCQKISKSRYCCGYRRNREHRSYQAYVQVGRQALLADVNSQSTALAPTCGQMHTTQHAQLELS